MSTENVLRVRRTDTSGVGEFVVVNVTPAGSGALDLALIATEAEHVYPTSIKESNVKSLQASNHTLDEWRAVLKYTLLRQEDLKPPPLEGLETVATINNETLTILIRQNISGITLRLGSISIRQDDEAEANPFDWCLTAVGHRDELQTKLETLQSSFDKQVDEVTKLNKQLDEFVRAKKQHEDELLKKFAALLNAKKLKIRDQQRLLAGAKLPKEVAKAVRESRDGDGGDGARKAGASRRSKRKAGSAGSETATEDEDEDEDDELVKQEQSPQQTPQPSDLSDRDDVTEDEDGFEAPPPPSQRSTRGASAVKDGGKFADLEKHNEKRSQQMQIDGSSPPPPKRELPFAKRGGAKAEESKNEGSTKPPAAPSEDDNDEDEETDEEL